MENWELIKDIRENILAKRVLAMKLRVFLECDNQGQKNEKSKPKNHELKIRNK